MKHLLLLLTFTAFVIKSPQIEFYEVPFGCSVKPGLGCGSAAKPILLSLIKHSKVKEAWMNHSGTVVGIVWKKQVDAKTKRRILAEAFHEWEMIPDVVSEEENVKHLKSFQSKEGWYREEQVDMLSLEEAEEYADILMGILQKKEWINEQDVKPLWEEMADYFRKELIITRNSDPHERWAKAIKSIMNKYVASEKVDSITLWNKY
jgi:hypothetical protein